MEKITLSDGEWRLMNALWQAAPCSNAQLVRLLGPVTGWNKSTIHIMLGRLAEKGAVEALPGHPKTYRPCIDRTGAVLQETRSFLGKVCGGSIGSLVNCMVQNEALSQQEIEELYDILRRAEEANGHD